MGMFNKLTDHCKLVSNGDLEYYVIDRMEEVKTEMLRLLMVVDQICLEKGLKYWIDGGTLIGAVRHNGFIPWDDDIDISMMKNDYKILIRELEKRENKKGATEYLLYSGKNKNKHCCNYLCSNINIYGRLQGGCSIIPIKLDIRPINVINNTVDDINLNKELREIANEHLFKKKVIPLTPISKQYQEMNPEQFFNFYNEEYGFGNCKDENMILTLPYYEYASRNVYPSSLLSKVQRVRFENQNTYIPLNYNEYLTPLYGEYMKYPPLECRVPACYEYHSFKKSKNWMKNFIVNSPKNRNIRLLSYIRLYGLSKFISIVKEGRLYKG